MVSNAHLALSSCQLTLILQQRFPSFLDSNSTELDGAGRAELPYERLSFSKALGRTEEEADEAFLVVAEFEMHLQRATGVQTAACCGGETDSPESLWIRGPPGGA